MSNSSDVKLPSRDGVALPFGICRDRAAIMDMSPAAGDFKGVGTEGDSGIIPLFSFCIVGQADGDGMISEGYRPRLLRAEPAPTIFFNDAEHRRGTSSDSSSVRSYKSLKSACLSSFQGSASDDGDEASEIGDGACL